MQKKGGDMSQFEIRGLYLGYYSCRTIEPSITPKGG